MTGEPIQQGNLVELAVEFTNRAGELADPTTVTCQIRSPSEAIQTPGPIKDSTGKYHCNITVGLPGRWKYRFAGTGALLAAAESEFWVANSDLI